MARILVIDDDPFVTTSLRVFLEPHGHVVTTADCGRRAVKALASDVFDLVICDVFMPEMDGFETLRAIRERDPAVPVIVISGFKARDSGAATPDFLAMATQLGATGSLRKPFLPSDVLAVVDACLAERQDNVIAMPSQQMAG